MVEEAAEHRRAYRFLHTLRGIFACAALLLLSLYTSAVSQTIDSLDIPSQTDSLKTTPTDSLAILDSARSLDTGRPYDSLRAPLGATGGIQELPGYRFLRKEDLVLQRYFTIFDALAPHLPAYPISQGAPGFVRRYSYAGASGAGVSVLYNGRALRGVLGDDYDPELYPTEFFERAEILKGARAALYGSGEALMAINLPQPRYDVEGSYVRIQYSQGSNDLTSSDLTFSRNLTNRLNLTMGFSRIASDGEFPNQSVSTWGGRGSLLWNATDALSLSLTEVFADATRGVNGGLQQGSGVDPVNAFVVNDSLSERRLRHDVTLAGQWYPGRTADSALVHATQAALYRDEIERPRIDAALYYTYSERDLQVGERIAQIDSTKQEANADIVGARGSLRLPLAFAVLSGNGMFEVGEGGEAHAEAGGMLDFLVGEQLVLRGGAKLRTEPGPDFLTFFGEGVVSLSDSLSIRGSVRQVSALSDTGSGQGAGGAIAFSDYRTSLLAEGEVEWRNGNSVISVGGFFREAQPIDEGSVLESYTITGGNLHVSLPIEQLVFETRILATLSPEGDKRFPEFYTTSDLYGNFALFADNLHLRLGTSLEYQSGLAGAEYDPVRGDFVYPIDPAREPSTLFPNWAVYGHARIGSAYIRVALRNILESKYWTAYRYPIWGRSVTIQVTWALVD